MTRGMVYFNFQSIRKNRNKLRLTEIKEFYSLNVREESYKKVLSLFPCFFGRGRVVMLWAGNFVASQGQAG